MKRHLIFFACICCFFTAVAQELYMPRNIRSAYDKGTRSFNGSPGRNYWQNHGLYDISLHLDNISKKVTGKETIIYTNNSPDTLSSVTIRFVNNIHKPQAPRSGYVDSDYLSDGLTIHRFETDNESYEIDTRDWGTAADVKLKKELLPGAKIRFVIEWSYPLSKRSGREGQIDDNTFFMAYAYPRVSVYDDYNRWDKVPHRDDTEFYNDFNDYKVAVKVPENFVVWGTGDLLNPEEVLQEKFLKRYKESLSSDQVIHVANAAEMIAGSVTRQNGWNAGNLRQNTSVM